MVKGSPTQYLNYSSRIDKNFSFIQSLQVERTLFTMFRVIFVSALLIGVYSESVTYKSCREPARNCVVSAVSIDPCPESATKSPCKLKRGKTTHLTVDFTPDFDTEKLEGRWYWENGGTDLPLMGIETNGCTYTTCPLKKGEKHQYNFDLDINRRWPTQTFDIKLKITGDTPDKECCFVTAIKITR